MDDPTAKMGALVELVRRRALAAPLDRVEAAVAFGEDLTTTADELVGHFIDEARRDGYSWTAIGERLGVSKQAARQRFGEPGAIRTLEGLRLMPRLHTCLDAARHAAMTDGSPEVGTHHQLLGLFHEGVAAAALDKLGVTVDAARAAAHALFPPAPPSAVPPPNSIEARDSLERAARLARRAGCDYLGTEHLLYAIAFDAGSRARRVLNHLNVNLAELKAELTCFVEGTTKKRRRRRKWDKDDMCSFCGKRRLDEVRLVAGPGVWICEDCVRLCTEILVEERQQA